MEKERLGNMKLSWDSNPYAFGSICLRVEGRKRAVGAVWSIKGGIAKGHLFGDVVYEGCVESDAMKAVESAWNAIPENIKHALKDQE